MDETFNLRKLAEKFCQEGIPKTQSKKMRLIIELENWCETFLKTQDMRGAARRVGSAIIETESPLIPLCFGYYLFTKHPKSFSHYQKLIQEELSTGYLLLQEEKQMAELRTLCEGGRKEHADDLKKRTKEFTLEEFYNKVWSTPAKTLAAELGISDVMIGKICRKHKIPKPTLGYWAKYYAGHKVKQLPFPKELANSSDKITIVRRTKQLR